MPTHRRRALADTRYTGYVAHGLVKTVDPRMVAV